MKALLQAMRPTHWTKNILLLFPCIAGHVFDRLWTEPQLYAGVVAFCLAASAIYLFNDLVDAAWDRRHPLKKHRPIAAGTLTPAHAKLTSLFLVAAALAVAFATQEKFGFWVVAYLLGNLLYTLWLKKIALLDIGILMSFYLVRLYAGASLAGIELSAWLVIFFILFFVWAGLMKRWVEMRASGHSGAFRKGYPRAAMPTVLRWARVYGMASLIVPLLYTFSEEGHKMYAQPFALFIPWLAFVFWMYNYDRNAKAGRTQKDPYKWSLSHPGSYATFALLVIVVVWARA